MRHVHRRLAFQVLAILITSLLGASNCLAQHHSNGGMAVGSMAPHSALSGLSSGGHIPDPSLGNSVVPPIYNNGYNDGNYGPRGYDAGYYRGGYGPWLGGGGVTLNIDPFLQTGVSPQDIENFRAMIARERILRGDQIQSDIGLKQSETALNQTLRQNIMNGNSNSASERRQPTSPLSKDLPSGFAVSLLLRITKNGKALIAQHEKLQRNINDVHNEYLKKGVAEPESVEKARDQLTAFEARARKEIKESRVDKTKKAAQNEALTVMVGVIAAGLDESLVAREPLKPLSPGRDVPQTMLSEKR